MTSYAVEYRDSRGQPTRFRGRYELDALTSDRAHELAMRHCRYRPEAMAFIYLEVEKPYAERAKRGKTAMKVQTVARVFGRGYMGPKDIPSTMQRKARGRTSRLGDPVHVVA